MIAGVDGCPKGWVAAVSAGFPSRERPHFCFRPKFMELLEDLKECRVIAVDMPIGLPAGAELRACDLEAKRLLGPKAQARVFPAPPRSLLAAATPEEFQAGHRALLGKGAPVPLWRIIPKIREVDACMTPELQNRIVEAHPEPAFRHLAGEVLPSKHNAEGIAARTELLERFLPNAAQAAQAFKASPAKTDDLLDALALLSTADHVAHLGCPTHDSPRRLPAGPPPIDEKGLRMEIWF